MPKTRRVPMRLCLGCNGRFPKRELVRVVRTPEGVVQLDPTGKANGRGAYICRKASCLKKGRSRLAKALEVDLPDSLVDELAGAMEP